MTSKHPKRCETCEYKHDCGIANKDCPITFGDVAGELPPYDTVELITSIIGCASHSSASGPAPENCPHWHCGTCNKSFGLIEEEARKEERERVLHALAKALEKRFEYVADYGLSEYEVLEVVDAQRQQEEP